METASELSKPALEAIDEELIKKFGDEIRNDRVKQMCGNMVRQIMVIILIPIKLLSKIKFYSLQLQDIKKPTVID